MFIGEFHLTFENNKYKQMKEMHGDGEGKGKGTGKGKMNKN
jgi:hypothetical protein